MLTRVVDVRMRGQKRFDGADAVHAGQVPVIDGGSNVFVTWREIVSPNLINRVMRAIIVMMVADVLVTFWKSSPGLPG